MGVQDREWYWEERRRKEQLYYNPKVFRRRKRPTPNSDAHSRRAAPIFQRLLLLCVAVLCLGVFVSQWRRHDISARKEAAAAVEQQKLRLQAAERDRAMLAEHQTNRERSEQDAASRLRAVSAQREADARARISAADESRRHRESWERFYKPDPACERSATVECANAFIRARRRFEETYAKGRN
jgi:uncharacterized protein HemX